jgi:hypothetical protein
MTSMTGSDQKKWKQVGNCRYAIDFPAEWVMTERDDYPEGMPQAVGTGPRYCDNCLYWGSNSEGIFEAYCLNCADYVYKGKRGEGRGPTS